MSAYGSGLDPDQQNLDLDPVSAQCLYPDQDSLNQGPPPLEKKIKAAIVVPYLLATVRREGDTSGQVSQLRARLQGQTVVLLSNVQPPAEFKK